MDTRNGHIDTLDKMQHVPDKYLTQLSALEEKLLRQKSETERPEELALLRYLENNSGLKGQAKRIASQAFRAGFTHQKETYILQDQVCSDLIKQIKALKKENEQLKIRIQRLQ